jgi:hypothetical protein
MLRFVKKKSLKFLHYKKYNVDVDVLSVIHNFYILLAVNNKSLTLCLKGKLSTLLLFM